MTMCTDKIDKYVEDGMDYLEELPDDLVNLIPSDLLECIEKVYKRIEIIKDKEGIYFFISFPECENILARKQGNTYIFSVCRGHHGFFNYFYNAVVCAKEEYKLKLELEKKRRLEDNRNEQTWLTKLKGLF